MKKKIRIFPKEGECIEIKADVVGIFKDEISFLNWNCSDLDRMGKCQSIRIEGKKGERLVLMNPESVGIFIH